MITIEKLVKCFWLLLLIYVGSNQMLKAQDTAHVLLKSHNIIDVCGIPADKEYTISISIGEVKPSDSLFGFDFYIRYNPAKFSFSAGLTMNTLSEFFEKQIFNSISDSGLIIGHVGTYSAYPSFGNKPLVAFTGRFLGQCPDTGIFRLEQLDFTEEFKKIIDDVNKFVVVSAEKTDKPDRNLTVSFEKDTFTVNKDDSLCVLLANITAGNNLRLENIEFEIIKDSSDAFIIDTIKSLSDESIRIDSTKEIENGYIIYTSVLGDISAEPVFQIKIKELIRRDETKGIRLTPKKVNDCACITRLTEGKTNIRGNKPSDTVGLVEYENKTLRLFYRETDDKIVIEEDKGIKEIRIFDIMGNLIKKINLIDIDKTAEIPAEEMTAGVYMITLKNMENEIKKIVMIKN